MARGGRKQDRDAPERRCIVTGDRAPAAGLLRFALAPDGTVVPDILGKLPGRGAWLTSSRAVVETACRKRAFNRAFRGDAAVSDDMADRIEALLADSLVRTISMARRAGAAVTGSEKVRARLESGAARMLVQASDGADGGISRLAALARAISSDPSHGGPAIEQVRLLDRSELGLAFGREFAIHACLDAGGFAERAMHDSARLAGFRGPATFQNADGRDVPHDAVPPTKAKY